MFMQIVHVTYGAPAYSDMGPSHQQHLQVIEADDVDSAKKEAEETLKRYKKGSGSVTGSVLVEVQSIPLCEGFAGLEWKEIKTRLESKEEKK